MKKIAYAGFKGAFAHLAKCEIFKDENEEIALSNFTEVFDAVSEGRADFGVIPIENNVGGPVWEVYKLICDHKELSICKEHFMRISHCLVGLEISELKDIETVISHPQALAQCSQFLKSLPNKVVRQAANTTTHAAKHVLDEWKQSKAAICSEDAAKRMGLTILQKGIENESTNTTRFVVVCRKENIENAVISNAITSVEFSVNDEVASLYNALGCFTSRDINFLNLRNFLIGTAFKPIKFYLEVEGYAEESCVKDALANLSDYAYDIEVLGSYSAHRFRK